MAYQTRGRDPLFDSDMQAAIEKRGKELLGIGLVLVGLAFAAMIYSYHPDDPSFLSATDAPVQNWLGRWGASVSALLIFVMGSGAWAVALALCVWGGRMIVHLDLQNAWRLIFLPILIAMAALYAATLTPEASWPHDHGLGGKPADLALGFFLNLMPFSMGAALKLASAALALGTLAMGLFVMGVTLREFGRAMRFLLVGIIMTYATLLTLLGKGAHGAVGAAHSLQARNELRRAARVQRAQTAYEAEEDELFEEDPALPEEFQKEKPSLLKRMPSLIRRADPLPDEMPEPELMQASGPAYEVEAPGDDRIKAKISDVIRNRMRRDSTLQVESVAPLTKGRGRGPDPLLLNPHPQPGLRAEPPLTAARRAEPPLRAPAPQATPVVTARAPTQADSPFAEMVPQEDFPESEAEYAAQAYAAAAEDLDSFEGHDFDERYAADDYADHDDRLEEPSGPVTSTLPPMPRVKPTVEPRKVVQPLNRKPIQPSTRAKAEAQPALQFEDNRPTYELPPLGLLDNPANIQRHHLSDEALEENARMLENVLDDYGVKGEIVSVRPGPVVTMYELEPAPGLKASRVIGLADDIARSMSALSARVSTVPGRSVIGIELPNENREKVVLREILAARDFGDSNMKLPLALGKDIGGDPIVANLAKMPHLLIAGTTGSGKSVAINTMILSLLYKLTPEECRLIMIDPKMLELSVYDGIPHLLSPVVTDPKKAVVALKWVVGEMEDRYRKMSKMGVRNIDGYNSRVADALAKGETFSRTVQTGFDDDTGEPVFETEEITPVKMPYIVVIVDEMADLMMVAGKEIEACIQRLAQMARASGIHLIMATQRPSVDVITGTIKANFPTRISFQVTSKIDSRTILGEMGAEQLLGMGDMLYMAGGAKITRCHGPFVSDEEVEEIVTHLKSYGPPDYVGGVVEGPAEESADNIDAVLGLGGNTTGEDALYDQAVAIVAKDRKCSTSYIQRKLAIGYNKAARLVEQMEDEGVVSTANHVGKREVLVPEMN